MKCEWPGRFCRRGIPLVMLFWPGRCGAQSLFLRGADTRTQAPETVVAQHKEWGADLNFGGSFNRGNVDLDYLNGGFNLFKSLPADTAYLTGSAVYNTFGGVRVQNQGRLTARWDHALAGPWKAFAFTTHAYNQFLRLDYRETTGAGPWADLDWGPTRQGLSLALVQEYDKFRGGAIERVGRLSFRDLSRAPISKTAEFTADLFCMPKVDEPANYRISAELGLESLVWKDNLGLKVSWLDEYDSRPQAGVKHNDTLWLTSLTLHFGR